MKKYVSFFCIIFVSTFVFGQKVKFEKQSLPALKKIGVVDFSEIEDPYLVSIRNLEAPAVSGNSYKGYLANLKKEVLQNYPPNNNVDVSSRALVDPPQVITGFSGSFFDEMGVPLDNHLAVSGGQVISAINSQIAVKTENGDDLVGFTLAQLSAQAGLSDDVFDPRLLYDTEADRFIAVFLQGRESTNTNIVIAFSGSNDATGEWNVYEITGNPNSTATWTDYPMINVTKRDLIVTGNLIIDDEPWQTGFDETVLWQIDKIDGYEGNSLDNRLFKSISVDGKNIRNLCPVESGDAILESNCLFLSNRNFAIESDTIFLVELTGGIDDVDAEVNINVLKSNVSYGVPPNAEMFFGVLQTNDSRILEAFYIDNEIQFVGNTRNLTNNLAGIFHGRVLNVDNTPEVTLEHIIGPDFEIGYPGITYTGVEPGDLDAIISFGHTARNFNPGVSAIYFDPDLGYSDIITIKEGEGYIGILQGPLERWGDYAGSQRDFADPGSCWISGFYGGDTRYNYPWVVKMTRPQIETDVQDIDYTNIDVSIFPNPTSERFKLQFEMPSNLEKVDVILYNQTGKLIDKLVSAKYMKPGLNDFSFDVSSLVSGIYQITIVADGKTLISKSVVVK